MIITESKVKSNESVPAVRRVEGTVVSTVESCSLLGGIPAALVRITESSAQWCPLDSLEIL